MKQAVIHLQGKQYKVSEGDLINVNRLTFFENQNQIEAKEVNLFVDGQKVIVGNPHVNNAKAVLEVIDNHLGKKVISRTFHRRKRFTKTKGHRQQLTKLKVKSITIS